MLVKNLEFQALPYAYSALEPYIDAMTMEIHHSKHHKAYFDNMMNAVKATEMENTDFMELLANISKYPVAVRNNGGGFYNHQLYWNIMGPNAGGQPTGTLAEAINKEFGSFENFKNQISDAAVKRFGSGWAWLSVKKDGSLCVCSSPNQDNPLMDVADCKGIPILGIDVWEHAYYLKYQNRRPEYLNNFFNVINWDRVQQNYNDALQTEK